jgi:hypothetical protein
MKKRQRRKKAAKTVPTSKQLVTPRATLAAIGVKLRALGLLSIMSNKSDSDIIWQNI